MVRIGEDRRERIDVVPAQYRVIVTIRPKYACPKGRAGVVQVRAPVHLLEGSWPTEAMLAHIAVAKHSEHVPLNRQARVMARHGFPVNRSVLADWMGRVGAHIAPVVDRMAVLRDDRGWGGPLPPGVVFHYRPGRSGEHAEEILSGFEGTIQVDAYGGYHRLSKPDRTSGKPLKLAFCWSHGRRKLIEAKPKAGSPIVTVLQTATR